jgi:hypothetical protein
MKKGQTTVVLYCLLIISGNTAVWASPDAGNTAAVRGLENVTLRNDGALIAKERIEGKGNVGAKHLIIEGVVAPGDSPGCINFAGNVTFNNAATLQIEIGGKTLCTEYDKINVANLLTLNNPTLEITLINGFEPQLGDRFDVMDWGSITGTFSTINSSAAILPAPFIWDTSELYLTGELAVSLPEIYQIPIPNAVLAALGLLFVGVFKLRGDSIVT